MQLKKQFDDILDPLGENAADFYLAASLYHARKISFMRAADLAGLCFEEFLAGLQKQFGKAFIVDEKAVLEDIAMVQKINATIV